MNKDLTNNCNLANDENKEINIVWDDISAKDYCQSKCGLYNRCNENRERCAKKIMMSVFDLLTKNEKTVLKLRCGFCGGKLFTLQEVAECLGITRERVRQIEAKAWRKLRHPARRKTLLELGVNVDGVGSGESLIDEITKDKN